MTVATLAAATDQCNTGTILCCESLQDPNSPSMSTILLLLGIPPGSIAPLVGVNCSPISVIGVGGSSCSAQPACCTSVFNGIIASGCTPINLNL